MTESKPNADATKQQSAQQSHDKAAACHDQASSEHKQASKCCASNDQKGAELHSNNAKDHADQAALESAKVNKHDMLA
jgi:hypothetical protein